MILLNIQKTPSPEPTEKEDDNNLNDIIAQIKKENEELLAQLDKQKAINAELSKNSSTDFKSVSDTGSDKNGTTSNGKSLSDIVESQNKIITDLTNQLKLLQSKSNKKIKELEVINIFSSQINLLFSFFKYKHIQIFNIFDVT